MATTSATAVERSGPTRALARAVVAYSALRTPHSALGRHFGTNDGSGLVREQVPATADDKPYSYEWPYSQVHIAALDLTTWETWPLRDATVDTVRPMDGDPADYAVLDAAGGRFAITMTCAANALGRVPEGDFARCAPDSARAAIAPLAAVLGTDVATAAKQILDAGIAQVKAVVDAMVRDYRLDKDTAVVVGGGGGAASVTPHLARTSGMEGRIARHNEVISPTGVALALVREQVERIVPGATQEQILAIRAEAERAVVAQGAAAEGVEV